ncbi:MAG: hypothetical protein HN742_09545 [Lentisphaerae bacterium]|nr:hypothetical protein [Lentisphaerota bacterium]MBT5606734.1 hypothetical protein [Lentisphaerota bacterium]MBT7842106.1 hypothetical protein [Lentisphaerota bacterium]
MTTGSSHSPVNGLPQVCLLTALGRRGFAGVLTAMLFTGVAMGMDVTIAAYSVPGSGTDAVCPAELERSPNRLVSTIVPPVSGTHAFGISIEADVIRPLAPGMPPYWAADLKRPLVLRYPYDWTWTGSKNVLNRPRLIMPGIAAGGRVLIADTRDLWSLRLEATSSGAVRALLLAHSVTNDGADSATPRVQASAGQRCTFTVQVFDDLSAAKRARSGALEAMSGRMTQPAYRGWTAKSLSPAEYGRVADGLKGVFDVVVIREVELHDWIPALFHERGIRVLCYQYLGALRRHSAHVTPATVREMGLRASDGSLYTAPKSPSGAWLLCDIRRPDVRKQFVRRACAAVDAGFDGVFLDGYPFWADASGRRGGNVPGAMCSLAFARWQLLREIRLGLAQVNPAARLGVLSNQYYDALGEAHFALKELMYGDWALFARDFSHRCTRINSERDMAFERDQAPFIPGVVAHGAKGYSPISVQSSLHFLRHPTGLTYIGCGDFFRERLDHWLSTVCALATDTDVYVRRIVPVDAWVHVEGRDVIWAETSCTVNFAREGRVTEVGHDAGTARVTATLDMRRGQRYQIECP